jgi:hypothetical protein
MKQLNEGIQADKSRLCLESLFFEIVLEMNLEIIKYFGLKRFPIVHFFLKRLVAHASFD